MLTEQNFNKICIFESGKVSMNGILMTKKEEFSQANINGERRRDRKEGGAVRYQKKIFKTCEDDLQSCKTSLFSSSSSSFPRFFAHLFIFKINPFNCKKFCFY